MTDLETVMAWQRGEIDGYEARRRIGARSYGDLYRVLHDHGIEPTFRPGNIARQAGEDRISLDDIARVYGLEEGEAERFVRAWLMSDARERFRKATEEIASERRFGGPGAQSTKIEMLEEATRLVNEAKDKHL